MLRKVIKYGVLFIALLIVFLLGVPMVTDDHAVEIYFLCIFLIAFAGIWFVNGKHVFTMKDKIKALRILVGVMIIIFIGDLLVLGWIIDKDNQMEISNGGKISADYITYKFWNVLGLPQFITYILVYPVTITAGLFIADVFFGKRISDVVCGGV